MQTTTLMRPKDLSDMSDGTRANPAKSVMESDEPSGKNDDRSAFQASRHGLFVEPGKP